jgi:biopolymer transport protein ExbD
MTFDQVKQQLTSIAQSDPKQTVIINCGPNAVHQKLVKILDLCTEVGLKSLNVVNDESIPFQAEHR